MLNKLKAFFLGLIEFRLSFTTNCGIYDYYYDVGRELAHKLTLRYFES